MKILIDNYACSPYIQPDTRVLQFKCVTMDHFFQQIVGILQNKSLWIIENEILKRNFPLKIA